MTRGREEEVTDTLRLIPEALKRVRQATGLRQIDVSKASGLSKAMVSAYEGGKALPSLQSLWAYLRALGRDMADLQEALDELEGFPKRRSADVEAKERSVGRAVLKALRGLDEIRNWKGKKTPAFWEIEMPTLRELAEKGNRYE